MNLSPSAFYDDNKKHLNLWWQGSIFIFILLIVNLILASFDQRTLADEAVWVKPIKFEISLIIHFFTLSLLASFLSSTRRNSKLWKGMSYLVVGSGVFEVLYSSTDWKRASGCRLYCRLRHRSSIAAGSN